MVEFFFFRPFFLFLIKNHKFSRVPTISESAVTPSIELALPDDYCRVLLSDCLLKSSFTFGVSEVGALGASGRVQASWQVSTKRGFKYLRGASLHWSRPANRAVQRLPFPQGITYKRITRGQSTSVFNHIQYLLPGMGLCISTIFRRQSTGKIGRGAICGDCQWQRYAPFSCYAYWPMSSH
jgi:hypothetical protein